jgi:hypothetical protein
MQPFGPFVAFILQYGPARFPRPNRAHPGDISGVMAVTYCDMPRC